MRRYVDMRIACFGDLHAHVFKEFDRKTDRTGSQRLDYIVDTLIYIRDYCVKENIKYILFAGDAFHVRSRVNTIVYNAIYDTLKTFHEYGLEVIGIAGNHDQHDNSDIPPHSLHAFNDIEGIDIYGDLDIHTLYDGLETVDIYCVPYSKNAQRIKDWIAEAETYTQPSDRYSRICLFHLGISGGFVGKGNYPMADAFQPDDLRPDFFKYIVGGHFHRRQLIGGYLNFLYTGAPIQHSLSDEGEDKGFYILDTSKRWDIAFVPVPNPQFITMSMYDVANEDMQLIADEGHYVRLQVTESELPVALTYLPTNLQYKVNLQREYKEQTRVDVKIGMSFEEIISKYADEFKPEAKAIGLKILREVQDGGDS
jgi:DNA repair exonuclease SbcCD nuclease subunit